MAISKLVYATVGLIVLLIEDIMDGLPGAQKREAAIARIKEVVTGILGFWPAFIPDVLLGMVIDWVVSRFNADGTFRKGGGTQAGAPAVSADERL
ncbi:hypothetical protein [Meiothermus sp.]|uniref:hypothetical protein n=1 Tax=Meiothermus sp. TaxID=1955249 RepID=UPI00307E9CEF